MTTETTETTETTDASSLDDGTCTSCGSPVDLDDSWTMQAPHRDGDDVTCAACAGER